MGSVVNDTYSVANHSYMRNSHVFRIGLRIATKIDLLAYTCSLRQLKMRVWRTPQFTCYKENLPAISLFERLFLPSSLLVLRDGKDYFSLRTQSISKEIHILDVSTLASPLMGMGSLAIIIY